MMKSNRSLITINFLSLILFQDSGIWLLSHYSYQKLASEPPLSPLLMRSIRMAKSTMINHAMLNCFNAISLISLQFTQTFSPIVQTWPLDENQELEVAQNE